jgi:16S rRNA pseudouridine516 synthase
MGEKLRIDRILASTGRWSRREVKELVRAGRVSANGETVRSADDKFDREQDMLAVDGEAVLCRKHTYLMMNKPENVLSATMDPRRETVLDLLPEHFRRIGLFPAGRLDKDSVGLLLLTDDGELAHALLSPRRHVEKVYLIRTDGKLDEADAEAFSAGMLLEDGLHCLPAKLEVLPCGEGGQALVTLREGKYHQIKRMTAARGKTVTYLKRISMGSLRLDETLGPGQWRPLTEAEIGALRHGG